MHKLAKLLLFFSLMSLPVILTTLMVAKKILPIHILVTDLSFAYLLTLFFPALSILCLASDPEKFYSKTAEKRPPHIAVGLFFTAVVVTMGTIRNGPLFLLLCTPALIISFSCVAIILHYKKLFEKNEMLPKEK